MKSVPRNVRLTPYVSIDEIADAILGFLAPLAGPGRPLRALELYGRDGAANLEEIEHAAAGRLPAALLAYAGSRRQRASASGQLYTEEARFSLVLCGRATAANAARGVQGATGGHPRETGLAELEHDCTLLIAERKPVLVDGTELRHIEVGDIRVLVAKPRFHAWEIGLSLRLTRDFTQDVVAAKLAEIHGTFTLPESEDPSEPRVEAKVKPT